MRYEEDLMRVVGIDLAGVEKRPSGFCLLDDMRARTSILYKDGQLERVGLKVIEVFPGGAQDLLRIPRVQEDAEKLRMGLIELGLKGDVLKSGLSNHELDAITCALIGKYYLDGNYRALGDPDEIQIIMPKIKG
jgi:predicted RNase H-like nuclease